MRQARTWSRRPQAHDAFSGHVCRIARDGSRPPPGSTTARHRAPFALRAKCVWKRHRVAFPAGGSALRLAERVPAKDKRYENAPATAGDAFFAEDALRRAFAFALPVRRALYAMRAGPPTRPPDSRGSDQGCFGEPCERRDVLCGRQMHLQRVRSLWSLAQPAPMRNRNGPRRCICQLDQRGPAAR